MKTIDSLGNRVIALLLCIVMMVGMFPTSAMAVEDTALYGTVTSYTGGTVTGSGTANVEVLIENTTLQWVPANSLRAEGWWVGIDVVAPEGYSSDATYKVKSNPNAEYGEAKSFVGNKDGERDIQLWFAVSPESLAKFASQGRNLTMTYAFDWDGNKDYEQTVVFSVKPSEKIVLQKNGETAYPLGMVSTYTGGAVTGNGTANVEVLIEKTTLQWVPANSLRAEGWWVGIDVVAPEGYSSDATYKVKSNPNAEYGEAKSFVGNKDGERDIQLWFAVSPESLAKFASQGRNLTMTYAFDWDGNKDYEQTVVFSVKPSEKIVLQKNGETAYPLGMVSTYTGGTITGNGTANVEVLITDTTLNWSAADESTGRTQGWWVGIDVVAPEGYSSDATYKVKSNPDAEYGEAKSFAGKKDGERDIQLWFAVSPQSLKKFASEGRKLTMMYAFDWDGVNGYEQEITFSVDPAGNIILNKQEQAGFAYAEDTDVITYGDNENLYTILAPANAGLVAGNPVYSITGNEGEVQDNQDGRLKILKAGEVTITATLKGDDYYNDGTDSYVLTIKEAEQTGFAFDNPPSELTWQSTAVDALALINGKGEGAISWKITENDGVVATVDAEGKITLLKAGTFTIQAQKAGDACYNASDIISWTIEVKHRNQTGFSVASETITYNDVDKNAAAGTGRANVYTPIVSGGQTNGAVTYKLVSGDAVKIENNIINILKSGTVTIKATKAGNEQYNSTSAEFTLTIQKDTQDFADADAFKEDVALIYGETEFTRVASLEGDYANGAVITYTVTGDEIGADVDADGKVTFTSSEKKVGTITVTASVKGDDCYNDNSISYDITVSYLTTDAKPTVDSGWHTSNTVKVKAPEGYTVSKTGDLDNAQWKPEIEVDLADTQNGSVEGYLRNSEGYITDKIVIDNIQVDTYAPTDLDISYAEPAGVVKLLDKLFGIYNADTLEVTISAKDATSGVASLIYDCGNGEQVVNFANLEEACHTFKIEAQYRNQVKLRAVDAAGWSVGLEDGKTIVLDTEHPVIDSEYQMEQGAGFKWHNSILYSQKDVTVEFVIDESNADLSDLELLDADGKGSSTKTEMPVLTVNNAEKAVDWEIKDGKLTGTYTLSGDGDYNLKLTYKDAAGNALEKDYEQQICIDSDPPVISGDYKESVQTIVGVAYYDAEQTVTIVIDEHSFIAANVEISLTANGQVVSTQDYIKTDWVSDKDKHTLVLEFKEDAKYTLDVVYSDIPGNVAKDYATDTFTVDTEDPENLSVSYESDLVDMWPDFLNDLFGFAKKSMEVTIDAEDVTAGIMKLSYSINGESFTDVERDQLAQDGSYTFTIPAEYEGQVVLRATDFALRTTEFKNGKTVIVDEINPVMSVSYDNRNQVDQIKEDDAAIASDRQTMATSTEQTRFIYNGEFSATLQVEEAHFYGNRVMITVTRDGEPYTAYSATEWEDIVKENVLYREKTLTMSEDGDYVITVEYADESTNEMNWSTGEHVNTGTKTYVSNIHTIDTTPPEVYLSYTNLDENVANTNYHSNDRTAVITIKDRNFRPNEVEFTVTAKDVNRDNVTAFDYASLNLSSWTKDNNPVWTMKGDDTWQTNVEIPFRVDANYAVEVNYTDIAKNAATISPYERTFTVDHDAPEGLSISYSTHAKDQICDAISFGYFDASRVVTMTATDLVAGVEFFTISAVAEEVPSTATTIELPKKLEVDTNGKFVGGTAGFLKEGDVKVTADNGTVKMVFTVPAQFRGSFGFVATDMGHLSNSKDHPQIQVVDVIAPERTITYDPSAIVDKSTLKDVETMSEGDDVILYYNKDAVATIEIKEANFCPEGVTVKVNDVKVALDSQWTTPEGREDDIWTNTLTLKDEGDYVITIAYTDHSSNEMPVYTSQPIVIDKTPPKVDVKYSNENVIKHIDGRDYFNKEQQATITITEHNFRADDVLIKVSAKDIVGADVLELNDDGIVKAYADQGANSDSWSPYDVGTWRRADDTYEIRLDYTTDANYTFDIEYQDLAKNPIVDRAQDLFTVDTTAPTNLEISYSQNVVDTILNKVFFYGTQMTVDISATDTVSGVNNFVYSYLIAANVSSVNAQEANVSIVPSKVEGSRYTATFKIPMKDLNATNQFNGSVNFTAYDRSNNSETKDDAETVRIVVDNIKPTATVTFNKPVQTANDISYYNGNIEATIVINEANFDAKDVVVTVTKDNVKYPVNVSWRDNSVDVHTGTFVLTEDGDYIVSVSYKDKSGNQMTDYKSNELTLDTTAPVIKASNIKANSANKDEKYGFVIEISDINLNVESMKPVLKAVVKGEDGLYKTVEIDLGKPVAVVNGQTYTYTVENLADDALYTLTCEAKDMSNNETIEILLDDGKAYEQVQFSINRNGSVFAYGTTYTENLVGQYYVYSVYEDVVIVEINVDPVEEYSVSLNGQELKEGTDYTTEQSSKTGEWSKRTYTIKKELFTEEGEYNIIVTSTDKANTIAYSDVKNLALAFVVDQTKPVLTITGLEAGGRYQTDEQTVILIPTDEGGRLNSLSVIVMNSNGEPLTDTNGKNISIRFEMAGEELLKYLEENDGKVTFTIPEGLNNKVQIICNDCAVNAENLTNEYNELFERVTVSQSQFVIFFANKPLFYGTIAGVLAIIALIIILIKRKKDKKNKRAVKA